MDVCAHFQTGRVSYQGSLLQCTLHLADCSSVNIKCVLQKLKHAPPPFYYHIKVVKMFIFCHSYLHSRGWGLEMRIDYKYKNIFKEMNSCVGMTMV